MVKDGLRPADVGDVPETTAVGARCPSCSAALRPGAPWCTQCYAPAGAPAATAEPPVLRPAPRGDCVAAPACATPTSAVPAPTGTWPCSACAQPNDLALAACQGCGTPFLAAVRDDRPALVLPVVGDLLALSPVRRLCVAACSALVCTLLLALLALVLA